MFRAILRILAGMVLGVLIAWLYCSIQPPPELPKVIHGHRTETPDEHEVWMRENDKYQNQSPSPMTLRVINTSVLFATILGLVAAYSLLFDLRTSGLMQRQRLRSLDSSQL